MRTDTTTRVPASSSVAGALCEQSLDVRMGGRIWPLEAISVEGFIIAADLDLAPDAVIDAVFTVDRCFAVTVPVRSLPVPVGVCRQLFLFAGVDPALTNLLVAAGQRSLSSPTPRSLM